MPNRPHVCCAWVRGAWLAWVKHDPERVYRGRTHYEALGKLLGAILFPWVLQLSCAGPSGNRQILSPMPDKDWRHHAEGRERTLAMMGLDAARK